MGRLMKYELRSALRLFIPLWLGLLAIALVNGLLRKGTSQFQLYLTENHLLQGLQGLMLFLYIMVIFGIVIFAGIYLIMRFYQSTMKDEGYLTFTLPLRIDAILWSKALTAMILLLVSVLVFLLSLLVLTFWNIDWATFKESWAFLDDVLDGKLVLLLVGFLLVIPVCLLSSIFMAYLSMAIGQLSNKYRILVAVVAYVGINMVLSTISNLLGLPLMYNLMNNYVLFNDGITSLSYASICAIILGAEFAINLVLTAAFYFPTRHIFSKKLNLT